MAKSDKRLNAQQIILHNELVYLDQVVEVNLQPGHPDRPVNWRLIARTIPSFDEAYGVLRGFPDGL